MLTTSLQGNQILKNSIDWISLVDFADSKAQYERQFKKWGFRKNQKGPKWKDAHRRIAKRKRDGKDSIVYIDGVLIPRKRIQKEERHNFPTIQERYGEGKQPPNIGTQLGWLRILQLRVPKHQKVSTFARRLPFGITPICQEIFPGFISRTLLG